MRLTTVVRVNGPEKKIIVFFFCSGIKNIKMWQPGMPLKILSEVK